MEDKLVVTFSGDEAREGHLMAYEGAQSLTGLARGFTVVGHFAVTGEIRKRTPFSDDIKIYLEPPRAGSFDSLFTFLTTDPVGAGLTAGFAIKLIEYAFNKVIGKDKQKIEDEISKIRTIRDGDLDALVDAIEPAIRQAHISVGHGCKNITIINNSAPIARFNRKSAEYIKQSILGDEEEIAVSVGSYNANQRSGRVFVKALGKTVPFRVDASVPRATLRLLSGSLDSYTQELPSEIMLKVRTVRAIDDRVKSLIVLGARRAEREDRL